MGVILKDKVIKKIKMITSSLIIWFNFRIMIPELIGIKRSYYQILDIIWTILPCILLVTFVIPSFGLLYYLNEVLDPLLSIMVIGHQWYWCYEFSTLYYYNTLFNGTPYLLFTHHFLVLPLITNIRLLITSEDVIHTYAIPSFGIKLDAIPGRLNTIELIINKEGLYYGQCSELCGPLHPSMPLSILSCTFYPFHLSPSFLPYSYSISP